jgi:putative phosphoesterase
MLLGLISDIHGNVEAFQRAIAELDPVADEILVAGDAMYEYRFSNDVVELIQGLNARYIVGNHEMNLLSPGGARARSAPDVRQHNLEFLATVPTRMEVSVGGKRLLMVHGSPWYPYGDYLYASSRELKRCSELDVDILVLGHTHVPMVERFGGTLVVNPGSIGEGRGPDPERSVSYAVLDTDSEEVEIVRFPNPRTAGR